MQTESHSRQPATLATQDELRAIHAHLERIEQMLWWSNLPQNIQNITPRPECIDYEHDD